MLRALILDLELEPIDLFASAFTTRREQAGAQGL